MEKTKETPWLVQFKDAVTFFQGLGTKPAIDLLRLPHNWTGTLEMLTSGIMITLESKVGGKVKTFVPFNNIKSVDF
jgi:hypothetical protein